MSKTEERTLIIDCQVLQTNAWDRGMGKYSLSLLAAMNKKGFMPKNVVLMLNKNMPVDTKMLEKLKAACPKASLKHLSLAVPSSHRKSEVTEQINKNVLDEYVATIGEASEIDFLILSLFLDQVFIVFPTNTRKLLLFYDLIPLLFEKRYSARINYEDYLIRFRTIFEADLIYTISQTVADDISIYLGIPQSKLKNINGASIDRTHLKSVKPDFEVPKKYILMNSGDELRKNNLNAVKGFAEFNLNHGNEYALIITSFFGEMTTKELQIYSDQLIFSGNVSEAQLKWLYEKAEFIFFPSEYEGLGLPILEAIAANKKVACSNIPVFREISNDAFYYFDPADFTSIASGLNKALQGHDWDKVKAKYKGLLDRYTWDSTAESYSSGYTEAFAEKQGTSKKQEDKPKIAIFTPHPSGYSAIGKVVAESHAVLSESYQIDYYIDYQPSTHQHMRPDFLSYVADCYEATEFNAKSYKNYDAVIYNIGNSDYHLNTIKNALYLPGYVILHDTHLQGAFGELSRLGWITSQRLKLEELLNDKNNTETSSFLTSIVNNQLGVITHSEYAKTAVEKVIQDKSVPVESAGLPLETPLQSSQTIKNSELQIGLAGILADVKGLPLIEELASDLQFQGCHFKVFGFSFIKPETLDRLERFENLSIYRDPSDFEFQTYLSNLDVLINYRSTYKGETSLTVLEAMRYGVVAVVRKIGWYDELPSDSVAKATNEQAIKTILSELRIDQNARDTISKKATKYVKTSHSHEAYKHTISRLIAAQDAKSQNAQRSQKLRTGKRLEKLN